MENIPLGVETPEFEYKNEDSYAFDMQVAISSPESGYKSSRHSTVTLITGDIGGYDMRVALHISFGPNKGWHTFEDINAVRVEVNGDYEADSLVRFLQGAGLMTMPMYGNMAGQTEESDYD